MMKKQNTAIFILCTVLLAGAAQAGDKKNFVGSNCDYDSYTGTPKKNALAFSNNTTSTHGVVCPIVRDTNNNMTYVYLNVSDSLSSTPLLYSRRENAGSYSSTPASRYRNMGTGHGRYEWDEFSAPNNAALAIFVLLNKDKHIFSYRWEE